MTSPASPAAKPLVLITGKSGNIGSALSERLGRDYRLVGLDRGAEPDAEDAVKMDLGSDESVRQGLAEVRERFGNEVAAVIHLAAYFDFTGEESPLYDKVNVEGTRRLLSGLRDFRVERFIYASTMLVHRAGTPGEHIDEGTPLAPKWAYPKSKARAEEVIRREHGDMPYLILRMAGLYDDRGGVPTLTQQIARIYERDLQSYLYAGDQDAGQAFLHQEDMLDLFDRALARRRELPEECVILAGEEEAVSYARLQNEIGRLIHGEREWETLSMPRPLAKAGAWLQEKSEPLVPDAFDQGKKPFIRPFMIDLASDHYALDISKARQLLGWEPKHFILDTLPAMIAALKADADDWYAANRLTQPDWMQAAGRKVDNPEEIRRRHEELYRREHRRNLWPHFLNAGLGLWLLSSPAILGYRSVPMAWSDFVCGVLLVVLGLACLSWRLRLLRWLTAAVGGWLLLAPLAFWVPSAAAYLNGTLAGALVIGFAVCLPPTPGVSPAAALTGPALPRDWDFSPSSWLQRIPIIFLAFIGLFISRHLAAYQLGHIEGIWDPFFAGAIPGDGKNGSEEITTSSVSRAWPVPDAGLGALTYLLEILTGLVGSTRRWRTMPWLVLLFGIMIVPLGAVSITFIIIQPILLDTWCALCLIAAAAMLIQIPYSFDELVATGVFLWRRKRAGRPLLRILFSGDTEQGRWEEPEDEFALPRRAAFREMFSGGISLPWNLLLCLVIGAWLMLTRLSFGAEGGMANMDHLLGALIITVTVSSLAEVARVLRLLNLPLALALVLSPFLHEASTASMINSLLCGLAVALLSLPRGPVRCRYGEWERFIR